MKIINFILFITLWLNKFWILTSAIATNSPNIFSPVDKDNLISIIVPENFNTEINIDQLTLDFRQQLQRIRQQNRINKLESDFFTYKKQFPELLHNENNKILILLPRGFKNIKNFNQPQNTISKDITSQLIQRQNNLRYSTEQSNVQRRFNIKKFNHYHEIISTTKRSTLPRKFNFTKKNLNKYNRKNFEIDFDKLYSWNTEKNNDNNNWSKFLREWNRVKYPENYDNSNKNKISQKKLLHELNQRDDQFLKFIPMKNQRNSDQFLSQSNSDQQQEKLLIEDIYLNKLKKRITIDDCLSIISLNVYGQIYLICNDTNFINIPDNIKNNNDFGNIKKNENVTLKSVENNEEMVLPINIEVDDLKEVEKLIDNPDAALDRINLME